MNVKIPVELHNKLCELPYTEYPFGSQLHGIATEQSDFDYVRVISDDFYHRFNTVSKYYPNIHSFQCDLDARTQIIWMTERQFYNNLFSGDGNMIADIVILSGKFENPLLLTRTYKIIKGYLGVAKRDLKIHGKVEKKRFHAFRSLYMAENLINGILPMVDGIKVLKLMELPSKDFLWVLEDMLRKELNEMLDRGEIDMYPNLGETDELVKVMVNCNNVREFRYD